MESNSEVNKHNSLLRTFCRIPHLRDQAPNISIAQRGWIKVKGKGGMVTYWVNEMIGDNDSI